MSRQFNNGTCSCWKKLGKELEKHNTQLVTDFSFRGHRYLNVSVAKVDSKKRLPAKRVFASFCPFCGEHLKLPKEKKKRVQTGCIGKGK